MDYSKVRRPNAEEHLRTAISLPLHEGMSEEYILATAKAFEKVARRYAV
jgi:dTDP-4-amino-4,6-dideoxygalactose transaminase